MTAAEINRVSSIKSPPPPITCRARKAAQRFFAELERRRIAYVVLHSYEEPYWQAGSSDIDYAVAATDLSKIRGVLAGVARETGLVIAQSVSHQAFGRYVVLVNPENPTDYLKLDGCSHYAPTLWLFVSDEVLLAERRQHVGKFVAAPASEFIYLLAKVISNSSATQKHLPRLRQLAALEPLGVQERFRSVFGDVERPVCEWLADSAQLAELRVLARRRYRADLLAAKLQQRVKRVLRPPGFQITVLGPDGVGKSTLLQNLGQALEPCFSRRRLFKFRPDVFNTIVPETQPQPHGRPPRGWILSCAKIFYYAADWWLGFFVRVLPEKCRGALLLVDRDFNDVLVDQRRYLVRNVHILARVLRRILPQADATFILTADPDTVRARKPELPFAELQRQLAAYRWLARRHSRMHLIYADKQADEVARLVTRTVILELAQREQHRQLSVAKRLFDLFVAAAALLILAPVIAAVALMVGLFIGVPILFKQQRPGLHGRPFTIYKFRTMSDARNATGGLLPDAKRLSWFGRFLRSTSLDELPELINVFRGEMSIVGPRPLLMEYLPRYSAEQTRRHDVLPGITGLAQINGRNVASWPRKFELDVWYVDHRSMSLDLKIIATTVWKVLKREDINQSEGVTSERFMGNAETVESRHGVRV
jgi:sugar transferase EpsL